MLAMAEQSTENVLVCLKNARRPLPLHGNVECHFPHGLQRPQETVALQERVAPIRA